MNVKRKRLKPHDEVWTYWNCYYQHFMQHLTAETQPKVALYREFNSVLLTRFAYQLTKFAISFNQFCIINISNQLLAIMQFPSVPGKPHRKS